MPLFGGFVADSYLGRYRTIFICGILYIAGLLLLPASALDFSTWGWTPASITQRRAFFASGLVLISLGAAGVKSNIGPFGAEQIEARGRGAEQSFFNWFYWMTNVGALLGLTLVPYVQQQISFVWGFFIPNLAWTLGLLIFVSAQYNYKKTPPTGSILTIAYGIFRQGACKTSPEPNPNLLEGSERKFLARSKKSFGGRFEDHLVDGVSGVLKVAPFCLLMIMFWTINAQMLNSFFAQAERMDVRLDGSVKVPAAAINAFNCIGIILLIPVVDKVIYPFFERIGHPLSQLKKIGIGLVLSAVGVVVAGIVEIYRKKILHSPGGSHTQVLAGQTFTASNMSVFLLVPQYVLIGLSEIFAAITAMDFVYNQTHVTMQGSITGLYHASIGLGNWLSSAILSIVEEITKQEPWWSSEINEAKMENLMFLLAGLVLINTLVFCVVAYFYTYQDPSNFQARHTPKDMEVYENEGAKAGEDVQD
ncbi:solute carrier family 15 member 4-like [Elysia marginata]|uniref:Solute carrier family 15 member 4-like n=1 Tax=Elysia marginata TaxID=1093978 RepID=A0AAV4EHT3_9GAST|nr:solute carrier family 15 member 4-like [Elysia marginata]